MQAEDINLHFIMLGMDIVAQRVCDCAVLFNFQCSTFDQTGESKTPDEVKNVKRNTTGNKSKTSSN